MKLVDKLTKLFYSLRHQLMAGHIRPGMSQKSVQDFDVLGHFSKSDDVAVGLTRVACGMSRGSRCSGVDDPVRCKGSEPTGFRPLENPFYLALRT